MPAVYLGLGSNIDPEIHLKSAADELRKQWPQVRFSSVYTTTPLGYTDQHDFLNAVAMVNTDMQPEDIALHLRTIETTLHKSPPFRFGPRTIDLDLLLYGNTIRKGELVIPHPRMHERLFVLEPLCEIIDPRSMHPELGVTWKQLLKKTMSQECEKIGLKL
jgi:2-amino-4-hydroxy-6-hydroxymethyldihydropteridine diphosphokinase